MKRKYEKPQIKMVLPCQELMAGAFVVESPPGHDVDGRDYGKGHPSLNDAKQGQFSVWDDEEESDDVWN